MSLVSLRIHSIRNLQHLELESLSPINLITGMNGSGKTSLLEAIHFLGTTRSFRSHQFRHFLSHGCQSALVFARLAHVGSGQTQPLGVERHLDGQVRARFDGQSLDSAQLALQLPLQVLHSGTFELLDGSPAIRRQFLDWGCFHFNPGFIQLWRGFRRALKQRNSLLKYGKIDPLLLQAWNHEFIEYGSALSEHRQAYLSAFVPVFNRILADLLAEVSLDLRFSAGWDRKRSLEEALFEYAERERQQGFSLVGPQRADFRLRWQGQNAADLLSRGQKKLVVSALKLAQGVLYRSLSARPCIYLIDDLPAELDAQHLELFCHYLEQSADQCFITCVESDTLKRFWATDTRLSCFEIAAGQLV
ncbi:DNA replication/repair protein RecF [Nitrincola tapanii]|uniref:DNA replication and repair protein RecF n=1 Tax=Nitrincola tapanii TaxID=1708751 RepID=A0A5A9W2I4_9GAMM|nr:DNA replication/repair protein RecF [Nitrincola tapanii]KAA0873771.1 DNA replication/repair protein RecF [Nitrincola tapanii]